MWCIMTTHCTTVLIYSKWHSINWWLQWRWWWWVCAIVNDVGIGWQCTIRSIHLLYLYCRFAYVVYCVLRTLMWHICCALQLWGRAKEQFAAVTAFMQLTKMLPVKLPVMDCAIFHSSHLQLKCLIFTVLNSKLQFIINKIDVQANTKSVLCLSVNMFHNEAHVTRFIEQLTLMKHIYWCIVPTVTCCICDIFHIFVELVYKYCWWCYMTVVDIMLHTCL